MVTTLLPYKQNMVIPSIYLLNSRYFSISNHRTQSIGSNSNFKLNNSCMYKYSFSWSYRDDPNYSTISREYR